MGGLTPHCLPLADHATFPSLYLQAVEGVRPDITIANKYGYPELEVYADMPREVREGFGRYPSASEERFIERWVVEHTDRPVYFTNKRFTSDRNGFDLANTGLLFRAVREGEAAPEVDYWAAYKWHTVDPDDARGELTAEIVMSDYFIARGREHLASGETDEGLEALQQAKDVIGESQATLINIGTLCTEYKLFDDAVRHFAAAEELDADYPVLLANLAKVHFNKGEHTKALEYAERYLVQEPIDPEVNWLAADCLKAQGRYDEALAQLQRMGEFMSGDYRIPREMGFIHLNEKRDRIGAQRYFAKSLELNANQPELQQALARVETPDPIDALPNPLQNLVPTPQIPQAPQPPNTANMPDVTSP